MYVRNLFWVKVILSLDDSFKSKGYNKICHDVTQAQRFTLTNRIVYMKSV